MEHTEFAPGIVMINHTSGFFSCCSIRLGSIISYFNTYHSLPLCVDSSRQFRLYKEYNTDVTFSFFQHYHSNEKEIIHEKNIDFIDTKQFSEYKNLDFQSIHPFIEKYFSPSTLINKKINTLVQKYCIDFENICALFHRGNDKSTETKICSYDEKLNHAKILLEKKPHIRFLIQSDESEFIEKALATFPNNSFYCKDEIHHIPSNNRLLVEHVFRDNISERTEYFLAIMMIMSRCKHVILSCGNCDLWITLFRGDAKNVIQYCDEKWVHS